MVASCGLECGDDARRVDSGQARLILDWWRWVLAVALKEWFVVIVGEIKCS